MKIHQYITGIVLFTALIVGAVCLLQNRRLKSLKEENGKLNQNVEALLYGAKQYKTKDSLSAARISALELKLSDWEETHEEDLNTIKSLNLKNRDLKTIVDTQSETIIRLSTQMKDTIIWHDTVQVQGKYFSVRNPWYDFDGIVENDMFRGDIAIRDSLICVESVKYKRFLFFKTKKVKSRTMDVVSKNPYTTILDVGFISIAE